jgi:hypothetical protein
MDKVASISHDMSVNRTMFIKPIMSHNHTHSICGDKGANQSIPTCHHCGVTGHIRPNCFQIRSQIPWNKTLAPRKYELGFEEQVNMLSDQVKLISEKLTSPLMSKDLSWSIIIRKLPNKSGSKRKMIYV